MRPQPRAATWARLQGPLPGSHADSRIDDELRLAHGAEDAGVAPPGPGPDAAEPAPGPSAPAAL
eukprot:14271502-Alexandrium_andersonii.AAC.1